MLPQGSGSHVSLDILHIQQATRYCFSLVFHSQHGQGYHIACLVALIIGNGIKKKKTETKLSPHLKLVPL